MPYIIGLLVIVLVGVGFTLFKSNDTQTPIIETPAVSEVPAQTDEANSVAADYKDGTYSTQVTYLTPMRSEYLLDVTLTLANDVVTDATIAYSQGAEVDPNAQNFEAAYKTEVVGKDIDTLNLARVGGASLTTGAFNNALVSIKSEAKS